MGISDASNSNNGDGKAVLAAVIESINLFFEKYPHSKIIISGSNEIRTRLYQRIIKRALV